MNVMSKRVVITGMGVISPVGNDIETFWNSLKEGKCGIDVLTELDSPYDVELSTLSVKLAAKVKGFDPSAYGMNVATVRRSDKYTQYALAAAKQAMNDSGLAGTVDSSRLGVYVGSGIGGIHTNMEQMHNLFFEGARRVSPLMIPMMISNIASGTIAIEYHAQGPCLPVVTACATGTHAVGEAYRAIKHGYADAIIAGGAEASINSFAIAGFSNSKALSKSEDPAAASLPFDSRRAGFVMGEGAGIVILEEYEHAKARGAKIYAEVCGYGNTCDAHHITAPDPTGVAPANAMSIALEEAGYDPDKDLLYINAHGTGTPLNDISETNAIKKALGDNAYKAHISSTKSMTGHMLGAAGAVEIIVSALAMTDSIIPPTINLEQQDPECDLDYTPLKAKECPVNIAISNSLGFGGHNGTVALRKFVE